jgi:hypothetical protein
MEHHKLTPKFFFLSLGVVVALIASVTAFLNLVFETLNKQFPDALNSVYQYGYNTYSFEAARSALATLIIIFPAFLIISYFWKKATRGELGSTDGVIRKWMLYLITFLSGIVVVVDLVTLVRYFVAGEITTRFILKVAITLVVAAYVGVYYIFELKGRQKFWGVSIGVASVVKSSALVLALIIWSFTVIGTPNEQRAWRLDERRIQDLQSIQWQVINFWQQKEKLPTELKELSNPLSGFMMPVDPEFEKGLAYEYKKTGDMKFELCATFTATMPKGWQEGYGGVRPMFGGGFSEDVAVSSYPYPGGGMNESWDHEIGKKCFERTIDKDLYPPYPKELKAY